MTYIGKEHYNSFFNFIIIFYKFGLYLKIKLLIAGF